MNEWQETLDKDRRRVLITLLGSSNDYSANAGLLQTACAGFGHAVSADRISTDLAWLQEQGPVDLTDIGGMTLARLTGRGVDCANGAVHLDGIARKRPD